MREVKEIVLTLAPEMVQETSEEEELGKGEGMVFRAVLLLVPIELPALPLSKSCPVVVKKVKMQRQWIPQEEMQPPLQVVEHSIFHPYTQPELVDLSVKFWQEPLEPIFVQLLFLWDLGLDGIILSGSGMGNMASLRTQPTLQQRLQNA